MTTEQTRKLELIASDGQSETARFIDELFARVEALERENRRLSRIVDALEERQESGGMLDVGPRTPAYAEYVQSGAYDPRD